MSVKFRNSMLFLSGVKNALKNTKERPKITTVLQFVDGASHNTYAVYQLPSRRPNNEEMGHKFLASEGHSDEEPSENNPSNL